MVDISMKCPIWPDHQGRCREYPDGHWWVGGDRTGGAYLIDQEGRRLAGGMYEDEQRARLTTWLIHQRKLGIQEPVVTSERVSEAMRARPMRITDRLRGFYEFLIHYRYRPGETIGHRFGEGATFQGYPPALCAWTESTSIDDFKALIDILVQSQEIVPHGDGDYKLTAKGVFRLEEVETSPILSRQAFVAMWFSREMMQAYEEAISPAIFDAGYKPRLISEKHFNGKIDDEIIGEIRKSLFLVADFTCPLNNDEWPEPRGGVYFEAGYAKGLNREVIWTVKQGYEKYLHFDTKTFNHIVWNDYSDLKNKLFNRIIATVV